MRLVMGPRVIRYSVQQYNETKLVTILSFICCCCSLLGVKASLEFAWVSKWIKGMDKELEVLAQRKGLLSLTLTQQVCYFIIWYTFKDGLNEWDKKIKTSWAGSATLEDTTWDRLIFQLRPSISVDRLRHRTTLRLEQHLVRCSKLGGDTAQNSKMFEKQGGGTPHIRNLVIWSEVQTKVGTSHKVLQCFRSQGGDTAHSIWGYLVR